MEPMTMPAMAPPLRLLLLPPPPPPALGAAVTVTVVWRTPRARDTSEGRVAVGRSRPNMKGAIVIG